MALDTAGIPCNLLRRLYPVLTGFQVVLSRDNMVLRDQVALSVWGRKDQRTMGTSLLPSFTTFGGNLHGPSLHSLPVLQTIFFHLPKNMQRLCT